MQAARHRRPLTLLLCVSPALLALAVIAAAVAAATASPAPACAAQSPEAAPLALPAVLQAQLVVADGAASDRFGHAVAADGAASDRFGHAVALSGDTALIGALFDRPGGIDAQGSAYAFVRS